MTVCANLQSPIDQSKPMPTSFLDILTQRGINTADHRANSSGAASQDRKPEAGSGDRTWDFAFATGIECSNPTVVDSDGNRLRRDLLEECGHYRHWREDLQLV